MQLDAVYMAWRQRKISLVNLALILDEILELMRHDLDHKTYEKAFEVWGEIEIINAVLLDEGRTPTTTENSDIDRLVDNFYFLLRDDNRKANFYKFGVNGWGVIKVSSSVE